MSMWQKSTDFWCSRWSSIKAEQHLAPIEILNKKWKIKVWWHDRNQASINCENVWLLSFQTSTINLLALLHPEETYLLNIFVILINTRPDSTINLGWCLTFQKHQCNTPTKACILYVINCSEKWSVSWRSNWSQCEMCIHVCCMTGEKVLFLLTIFY